MTNSAKSRVSIDHVELFVPDRKAAVAWYGRVLGLEPVSAHAAWATERGPLMISADGGTTMIALFIGTPCGERTPRSHPRVAFRMSAPAFLAFVARDAAERPVFDAEGRAVATLAPVDHQGAYSVYFSDPWGHQLEVTTYEWREVAERLRKA